MPHSLCSDAASVPANRRCALQSSAWAVLRTRSLGLSPQSLAQCDGVLVPGVGRIPTRSTRHGSWHPPISSSAANAPPAAPGADPSHRRGPECRLRAHVPRGSGPAYRPRYAAFCRLFSSPHHIRAAPFFGGLDGLAIQDRSTGFRLFVDRTAYLPSQRVMDALPCAVQAPGAEIAVHRLPRRQVVWQGSPLASRTQHIQDRIHNLAPLVRGRPTTALDFWDQRIEHLPCFITQVTWVI